MARSQKESRRGAVAVVAAVLIIPLLAMLALSIDVGYMCNDKAELQNAADACALAGALQVMTPQLSGMTSSTRGYRIAAAANAAARQVASQNSAGKVTRALLSSDSTVGYLSDPTSQPELLSPWTTGQALPNAVQVVMRRDGTVHTPQRVFFGLVLGHDTWNVASTATAVFLQTSNVTGFKSTTVNAKLLPIAVDVNLWNHFLSTGQSPDGTTSDSYSVTLPNSSRPNSSNPSSSKPAPGNVTPGGDGIPEFNVLYPNSNSPGKFGLVDIGPPPPSNSTPTFENWILNGSSPADLSYFGSDGLHATPSAPASLAGGPALKSTLQTNLADIIGQPRIVPLFSSYTGQGSNTRYTIVGFAGVTIVSATGRGNNLQIIVQPIVTVDSTATTGRGSSSSFVYPTTPISLVR
jgi:Flp pilus assembly protein TadG